MNRHLHRIVFNKNRGQLMVVAEIDSGDHGGSPGSTSGTRPARSVALVLSALRLSLLSALGCLVWVTPGSAQVVVDPQAPSNQRPTLLTAGNGVPVVNIQTPSAGGVSRNTYTQFDVRAQGLVLNNSRTDVQSQLGGWLQANPWLATGGARVILNEVNSPNASQLRGYIEVAGQRAQVVIANAAGITCDGCGFINASRATLTTGTPIVNGGSLDGYRVRDGVVSVIGDGLDARQTDYTDIIARAVRLNAGIWAQDLRVTTGVNDVDAAHEQATPVERSAAEAAAAPTVAIDVAQLGGMYAGHIRLIGTEAGVGVRNAGAIGASVGEVVVTTEGWLANTGSISAAASTRIQAAGTLDNSGSIHAGGDTQVNVRAGLTNRGTLAALGNVQVQAAAIASEAGSLLAAGLAADLTLSGTGRLQLSAPGQVSAQGQNVATMGIAVEGAAIHLAGSDTQAPLLDLRARSGDIDATGATLAASQSLNAQAAQALRTDGAQVMAPQLQIQAHDWSNQGGEVLHTAANALSVSLPGSFDNTGGRLATLSPQFDLSAQRIVNTDGRIEQAGSGTLTLRAGDLSGAGGVLATGGVLDAGFGTALLNGAVTEAGRIRLQAGTLSHREGRMTQTGLDEARIEVAGTLDNEAGQIVSNGRLDLQAQTLLNAGGLLRTTQDAAAQLRIAEVLDNKGGTVSAGGTLSLSAGEWRNRQGVAEGIDGLSADVRAALDNHSGTIGSAGAVSLAAGQVDNTLGRLQAATLDLQAATTIDNSAGALLAQRDLHVSTGDLANSGSVYAGGDLNLSARGTINNTGVIAALGAATLQGQQLQSTGVLAAGMLASGQLRDVQDGAQDLVLATTGALQAHGEVLASGSARLSGAAIDLSDSRTSAQTLDLSAANGRIDTQRATVIATDRLSADATTLSNDAGHLQAGWLDLNLAQLSNVQGVVLQTGERDSRLAGLQQLDNQGGTIQSQAANLAISAEVLNSAQGNILHTGSGTLALQATTLDNRVGRINSLGTLSVAAGGDIDNQTGLLSGNQALAVTAANLDNRGGQVQSALGSVDLQLAGGLRNDDPRAVVLAGTDLSLRSGALSNTGTLYGQRDLRLDVAGTLQHDGFIGAGRHASLQAGQLSAGAASVLDAQGDLGVRGQDLALHGLALGASIALDAAQSLSTAGGRITGSQLAIAAHDWDNTQGSVVQTGASNLAIALPGTLDNTQGRIASNGQDLALSAQILDNTGGSVQHAGGGRLSVSATTLQGTDGQLLGNGDLVIAAHAAELDRAVSVGQRVTLTADTLSHQRGQLIQTGNAEARIAATTSLDNTGGVIASNGGLALQAGKLVNQAGSLIAAGAGLSVAVQGGIDNTQAGSLLSAGSALLSAARLDNGGGEISSFGTLDLHIGQDLLNSQGLLSGQQALSAQAGSVENRGGAIQSALGAVDLQVQGSLHNAPQAPTAASAAEVQSSVVPDIVSGLIFAGTDLRLQAGTLTQDGQMQALRDMDLRIAGSATHSGAIVAQRHLGLEAQVLTASASSVLVAGDMQVSTQQALTLQGQQQATGRMDLAGGNIDLAGSVSSAQDIRLVAREGDIAAAGAYLIADGSLSAQAAQTLRSDAAVLSARTLDLQAQDWSNRGGKAVHWGEGDLTLDLPGTLDNTGGTIASNAQQASLSAGNIANIGGVIAQSGATLRLRAVDIDNTRGTIQSAGLLDLGALWLDNRAGTLSAAHLQAGTAMLDNRGGLLLHTGPAEAAVGASQWLDNRGGEIASLGTLALQSGLMLNQAGRVQSADAARIDASALDNTGGVLASQHTLALVVTGALDNRDGGLLYGQQGLAAQAARLHNTGGAIQSAQGTVTLSVTDALVNGEGGSVFAGQNLTVQTGSLDNAGSLYALGDLGLTASDAIQHSGQIAAQGHASVQAQSLTAQAGSLLAAGLKQDGTLSTQGNLTVAISQTLNEQGMALAAGSASLQGANVNLAGSATSAGTVNLAATQTLTTASAQVNGTQLQISAHDWNNTSGNVVQTGSGDLQVTLVGDLDNSAGLIASNGQNLGLAAQTLTNAAGQILHAGTGQMSLTASTLQGTAGTLQSNGALAITATTAALNNARTTAAQITVDTATLAHRGGTMTQYGIGATSITAATLLDNTGGTIASNGATALNTGDFRQPGRHADGCRQ